MGYISDVQFFRDLNKHPDWDPETARQEVKKETKKGGASKENMPVEKEKEEKLETTMSEEYQRVIELVSNFSLKEEFRDDAGEMKILESRKQFVLKQLRKILNDVENYINQINILRTQKLASYDDNNQYRDYVGSSDETRYNYHNQLINDLKLLMKQANINFNQDFPETARIREEKKYADRKGQSEAEIKKALAKREYVEFPYGQGVIINWKNCPKNPRGEREFIMHWAFEFYKDLTKLKNNFIDNVKKIEE
jgi:hypothetical protein